MVSIVVTEEEHPDAGEHLLVLGREHLEAGRFADALQALQRASALMPLSLDVYRLLAQALQENGQEADAMSTRMAVDAIARRSATDLCRIGLVYFRHDQWDAAGHWFQRALMLDPDMVLANMHMSSILRQAGRSMEANHHSDRAYRQQSLFLDPANATQRRSILVLCSSRDDNVPFHFLLPGAANRLFRWVVEYGMVGPVRQLPHYDLVFNAIGDADLAERSRMAVDRFMAQADRPVINAPQRVGRTTRDRAAQLLGGIEGIHVPPTIRWKHQTETGAMHALIAAAALSYPVIARPAGEHGGKGITVLQSPQDPAAVPSGGDAYLSSYCEYRSDDGYFRKYRVIFVDRRAYPYHLAIGSHWVLHYATADMLSAPWKTEEELRFLDDPASVLGTRAWAALEAIGQRLDLDYGGIDFSILPDGRVLVFEANAAMLVHPEDNAGALKSKNPYIQRIFDALDRMLDRRMGTADPAGAA